MTPLDPTQPAVGVTPELQRLLALRFAARQLDIRRRRKSLAQLAGSQRSNFRGRGLEFDEVRGYQAGDDIRAIDWRVTARTGEAHTKLFHEDRERPVLLVVDQRPAMRFGSRYCFKSVLAAELAALLAWSALDANERVGALLMDADDHRELRPRNSRRAVLALLSALCETPAVVTEEKLCLADILRSARRVARTGSSLFLISDFHDADNDPVRKELFQLARHTEITAIHCRDPLEETLPPPGLYAVTDGAHRCTLRTGDRNLRERYDEAAARQHAAIDALFRKLAIPRIQASTVDAPLSVLRGYYGKYGKAGG
jgi:uncharacterized protein (DUF58 family)